MNHFFILIVDNPTIILQKNITYDDDLSTLDE